MWLAGFFGMATKYGEAILAVKYRVKDSNGQMAGGPMYYLEHGLKQKWLGVLFAIFGALAAFGIGNGTQSKAVADVMNNTFSVPHWITGIALVIFGALVILGGIKSIGRVTAFFVPIMALFYFIAGVIIMVMNIELIPAAFATIFHIRIYRGSCSRVAQSVPLSVSGLHVVSSPTKRVLVLLQSPQLLQERICLVARHLFP